MALGPKCQSNGRQKRKRKRRKKKRKRGRMENIKIQSRENRMASGMKREKREKEKREEESENRVTATRHNAARQEEKPHNHHSFIMSSRLTYTPYSTLGCRSGECQSGGVDERCRDRKPRADPIYPPSGHRRGPSRRSGAEHRH